MELVVLAVVVALCGYFLVKEYLERRAIDQAIRRRILNIKS